jgi:ubiquinone/menaquinone biosynthesis C-methylase UbiE
MTLHRHRRSACALRTTGVTLDHAARVYDWLAPMMTLGLESRIHRRVISCLAMDRPMTVLDVGCGTGSLTLRIAERMPPGDAQVVGIDAAERMIAVARRKAGAARVRFEAALAEDLPFPPASFDRVVCSFFFHHLDARLKARAIDEMHRVLRPNGRAVILDVDVPYNVFGRLCAYAGYLLFRQPQIKENIDGQLRRAVASSGFRGSWRIVSRHSGYLSLFELLRGGDPLRKSEA